MANKFAEVVVLEGPPGVCLLLPEPSAYTAKKRKAKVGLKGLPAKRAAVQKQLNIIREDSPAPKAVMGNGGKVIKVEEEEEEEDDQPTVRQLSGEKFETKLGLFSPFFY